MSDVVIRVERLSKKYAIGHQSAASGGYVSLRETVSRSLRGLGRSALDMMRGRQIVAGDEVEDFWALKDVSFEVKRGEVLGIIGRNGAGKSTLLKILSRITEQTTGRVELSGRVASLLEVGTGFHPELSGRENIYLNGAILGMGSSEIKRKFDCIVQFAEIEKFLDTPVKRYSSGMYVRLAFAVAAHLDPEILIVDEVLAVGDIEFQKRCLGKINEVAHGEGRTVLFVSHNLQAVRSLCSRAILMSKGCVQCDGPAFETVSIYQKGVSRDQFGAGTEIDNKHVRRGDGSARFTAIKLLNSAGVETSLFGLRESVRIRLAFKVFTAVPRLHVSLVLFSGSPRIAVTSIYQRFSEVPLPESEEGTIDLELTEVALRPGEYSLYFWLGSSSATPFDVVDDLIGPLVIATDKPIDELGYDPTNPSGFFDLNWSVRASASSPSAR